MVFATKLLSTIVKLKCGVCCYMYLDSQAFGSRPYRALDSTNIITSYVQLTLAYPGLNYLKARIIRTTDTSDYVVYNYVIT